MTTSNDNPCYMCGSEVAEVRGKYKLSLCLDCMMKCDWLSEYQQMVSKSAKCLDINTFERYKPLKEN